MCECSLSPYNDLCNNHSVDLGRIAFGVIAEMKDSCRCDRGQGHCQEGPDLKTISGTDSGFVYFRVVFGVCKLSGLFPGSALSHCPAVSCFIHAWLSRHRRSSPLTPRSAILKSVYLLVFRMLNREEPRVFVDGEGKCSTKGNLRGEVSHKKKWCCPPIETNQKLQEINERAAALDQQLLEANKAYQGLESDKAGVEALQKKAEALAGEYLDQITLKDTEIEQLQTQLKESNDRLQTAEGNTEAERAKNAGLVQELQEAHKHNQELWARAREHRRNRQLLLEDLRRKAAEIKQLQTDSKQQARLAREQRALADAALDVQELQIRRGRPPDRSRQRRRLVQGAGH
eukprot:g79460.t1